MKHSIYLFLAFFAFITAPSAGAQGVKWHPGHYVTLNGNDPQGLHFSHIDDIAKESAIKGVQVRIWWHELERSKGSYDFSKVDAYLKKLKSLPVPKRLVVRIMDRRFHTTSRTGIVPSYLLSDPIFKGGVVATKNGFAARLWEQPVMDRLIALYRAVGLRYDADAYFEGIATNESTLGFGSNKPAGYSTTALANQYKRFVNVVRTAMPKTNLFFNANWLGPDALMSELVQEMVEPGVATGGPNTVPGKLTQGQRVWTGQHGADYRGTLAISSGVETSELGGRNGAFTPKQIYEYANNTLRVNYLFWVRNTWNGGSAQRWSTGILPFLRTNPPLRTSCPSSYGQCAK
jgi:hypothetical protein